MSTMPKIELDKNLELDFSNLEESTEECLNQDLVREEENFKTEISSIELPSLEGYVGLYPDYFMSAMKETIEEGDQFFGITEKVRTPLVWLLINNPKEFSSACDRYLELYLNITNKLSDKNNIKLSEKALTEVNQLRQEIFFINLARTPRKLQLFSIYILQNILILLF